MNETYEYSDVAEYEPNAEAFGEWGESPYESEYAEYAEARPPRRRPAPGPVRTAPRQSAYSPRPSGTTAPVTQQQLQAALARVSQQIGVNSNAIKTVDGRVRGVVAEQGRMGGALRKEIADRKKDAEGLRRELQSTRELSALIPLVAPPGTTLGNLAPLAHLLPSETFTGGGGGGGSGSGGTGSSLLGGSGIVAMIAIAAASGAFK
jgi:hypothetical protein